MYRVITYRSRELKTKYISLNAADQSAVNFNEEKIFLIDGIEVNEEDLTNDERLDIEAKNMLNGDGFYNPLRPFDYYDIGDDKPQKKNTKGVIAVLSGAVVILIVLGIVFFKFVI